MRATRMIGAAAIMLLAGSCKPSGSVVPVPGDPLRTALGGEWLVLEIPRTRVLVGSAPATGGGYNDSCYIVASVRREGGWNKYEQSFSDVTSASLGVKILNAVGLAINADRGRTYSIVAMGWNADRAVNLRPNFANANCMTADGVPQYPGIGAVLVFDSLGLSTTGTRGTRLDVSAEGTVTGRGANGNVGWTRSQSGNLVSGGNSLAVALRLTTWRKRGDDRVCEKDISALAGAAQEDACLQGRNDFRFVATHVADNRYRIRVSDTRAGNRPDIDTTIQLGSRISLEESAQAYSRVFIERGAAAQFVKVRYIETRYDQREIENNSMLTVEERQALAGMIVR